MPNLSERASADRLLRPQQVYETLGIGASTLWYWVHKLGIIKPAQWTAGGHARYRASDVATLKATLSPAAEAVTVEAAA
jgi:predicted DNA-binding transcriptional regulator AlpA